MFKRYRNILYALSNFSVFWSHLTKNWQTSVTIGESLLTIFSILTSNWVREKLTKLPCLNIWKHGTIKCPKEFLSFSFSRRAYKKSKRLLTPFSTQKCSNISNIAFNMTLIVQTVSPIMKFKKLFNFLESIYILRDAFSKTSLEVNNGWTKG